MATIDKLEYINNTKNLIKNALNTKFNSQIGDGDTFRSYAQKIDNIYENWPKVSEENTNFTLNSTKEGKMKIELKGNTSQDTTIGKNLFTNIIYKDNYIVNSTGGETGNALGCIWQKIEVEPNTTYTLSYSSTDYTFAQRVSEYNSSDTFIQRSTTQTSPYTFTTTLTTEYINLSGFKTDTNIQIELGSTATSYEPYTNGASPNPDYPQDIHVVSGDNTIEIQGKNLFDKNNMHLKSLNAQNKTGTTGTYGSASNQKHIYIKCKPNTTYSIQKNNSINTVLGVFESSEEPAVGVAYKTLYLTTQSSNGKATVTTGESAKYLDIRLNTSSTSAENLQIILNSIQIEYSSTATTYESYQSQSYPINLGNIELCKIGDYRDSIVKDNGKWYLNKQTIKGTLNGTESWQYQSKDTRRTVFRLTIDRVSTNVQYLSNMFIYNDLSTLNRMSIVYNDKKLYVSMDNLILGIENSDTNSTKVQKFKTWLGNNPLEICRIAGTPTYTEITDSTLLSQLEALNGAKSYTTQTNITQTNNDLPFFINISALKKNSSN